jgi:hypothetical protein
MAFTITVGDPSAAIITGAAGTEQAVLEPTNLKVFADRIGIAMRIVRGATDTDITAIALCNEDGTETFIYPNAAASGLIVTDVVP